MFNHLLKGSLVSFVTFLIVLFLEQSDTSADEIDFDSTDISLWSHLYNCWYYGNNPDGTNETFKDIQYFSLKVERVAFDANKGVDFLLYNKDYPDGLKLGFDGAHKVVGKPIKFVVHGFLGNCSCDIVQFIKNAYLEHGGDFNMIGVDWKKGAGNWPYEYSTVAGENVPVVADRLGRYLVFLISTLGINIDDINLIGFSLGAHIVGRAAKYVQKTLNQTIPIIVGLDPASVLFKYTDPLTRLSNTDAKYVEVIHTASSCLGFHKPIGTADFYPNYSDLMRKMPGCGYDPTWDCSHGRAYEYFAESINSKIGFKAYKYKSFKQMQQENCTNSEEFAYMGGFSLAEKTAKGVYWLKTGKESPFAVYE